MYMYALHIISHSHVHAERAMVVCVCVCVPSVTMFQTLWLQEVYPWIHCNCKPRCNFHTEYYLEYVSVKSARQKRRHHLTVRHLLQVYTCMLCKNIRMFVCLILRPYNVTFRHCSGRRIQEANLEKASWESEP